MKNWKVIAAMVIVVVVGILIGTNIGKTSSKRTYVEVTLAPSTGASSTEESEGIADSEESTESTNSETKSKNSNEDAESSEESGSDETAVEDSDDLVIKDDILGISTFTPTGELPCTYVFRGNVVIDVPRWEDIVEPTYMYMNSEIIDDKYIELDIATSTEEMEFDDIEEGYKNVYEYIREKRMSSLGMFTVEKTETITIEGVAVIKEIGTVQKYDVSEGEGLYRSDVYAERYKFAIDGNPYIIMGNLSEKSMLDEWVKVMSEILKGMMDSVHVSE